MVAFFGRRARRLMPALVAYLVFAGLLVGVVAVLPVLFYVQNWAMVVQGDAPAATLIAWSLSIEEQFYLLWPWAVLAGLRWRAVPWVVAIGGALVAPCLRLLLWDGGAGEWRVFYGTDTRMDVLLLGCLLALLVKHRGGVPGWSRHLIWPCLAVVALCCLAPTWFTTLFDPMVIGLAMAGVIAGTLAGGARWLAFPVLRWFGRRSYALYLWHHLLVVSAKEGALPMWAAIAAALVLAELSWHVVERPWTRRSPSGVDPALAKVAAGR